MERKLANAGIYVGPAMTEVALRNYVNLQICHLKNDNIRTRAHDHNTLLARNMAISAQADEDLRLTISTIRHQGLRRVFVTSFDLRPTGSYITVAIPRTELHGLPTVPAASRISDPHHGYNETTPAAIGSVP